MNRSVTIMSAFLPPHLQPMRPRAACPRLQSFRPSVEVLGFDSALGGYHLGAAPADPEKMADKVISDLKAYFRVGGLKIGFSPDELMRLAQGFWLIGEKSQNQRNIEKNMRDVGERLTKLETVYRTWARRGTRDDGTRYHYGKWAEQAMTIHDAIREHTKAAWESSQLLIAIDTLTKTWEDVTKPDAWPLWVKVMIGLGIAVAAGPYLVPLVQASFKGASLLKGSSRPRRPSRR